MKKIAVTLLMAIAQSANASTCEELAQAHVFGKYEGKIDKLSWNSEKKEVLENKCTWDVSLRITRIKEERGTCYLRGEMTAKPIAHENYSPEGRSYKCASLDNSRSQIVEATNPLAPFRMRIYPREYLPPIDGITQIYPKGRGSGFIKKADGDLNFNDPREGTSPNRATGVLEQGRD